MGYRSDVRIMTSRKGFDELKKFTDKYLKQNMQSILVGILSNGMSIVGQIMKMSMQLWKDYNT